MQFLAYHFFELNLFVVFLCSCLLIWNCCWNSSS